MASRGRGRRGGGGGRRGPPGRGMPQNRRPYRRPPPPSREFQEVELLEKEEVECESKTIVIEFNSNDQGQFMKLYEANAKVRSRVILNMESFSQVNSILSDYLKDIDNIEGSSSEGDTERLKTESFETDRGRRYFADVRQNDRGKFVKLTMQLTRSFQKKTYVAFPLENLKDFMDKFVGLHKKHFVPRDDDESTPGTGPGPAPNQLASPREVRAGGKKFFFDVDRNERGVFLRLSEVARIRRTHINIPNSCWPQMAEVFHQLAQELPYEEEGSASNSASEDN